jgi:two-component system, NarL family, response regulator NreC
MIAMTVVLADDHPVVRQGVRNLLAAEPDISIVGEAEDGLSAVALVSRLQPDILVLDMIMPEVAGMKVLQHTGQCSPHTRVIAFSMCADDDYVWMTLQNGAAAYVLKNSTADELVKALREVMAGRRYLSPPLPDTAMKVHLQKDPPALPPADSSLTQREQEVLQLVAQGYPNAQIAQELQLSNRTIAFHVHNLLAKLEASNRTQAVANARQQGWLRDE